MKTITKNQLLNFQNFELSVNFIKIRQFLFLLFLFGSISLSAQENTQSVVEEQVFITSLRTRELNQSATYSNAQNLENLLYKIQPSVYFYSGTVNTYGEKPKNLFIDVQGLADLNNTSILKNNIELITIKIETSGELNAVIDLLAFEGYKNLKYVYILSTVETTSQNINTMVHNNNGDYEVFYKIQIGDNN